MLVSYEHYCFMLACFAKRIESSLIFPSFQQCNVTFAHIASLDVSPKSVRLVAGGLGFYCRLNQIKDFKILLAVSPLGDRQKQKCKEFSVGVLFVYYAL